MCGRRAVMQLTFSAPGNGPRVSSSGSLARVSPEQRQNTSFGILREFDNGAVASANDFFDFSRGAVAEAKPKKFRWDTANHRDLGEISVFRNDNEVGRSRISPNDYILLLVQIQRVHMV